MMMNRNVLKQFWNLSLKSVLMIISLIETVFIAFQPAVRDGLGFLWLLPFSFLICLAWFGNVIKYHGIGFKVFYGITVVRYLIQPLLIVITNGEVSKNRMSIVEPSSYYVAIALECMEIFVSYFTLSRLYPSLKKKYETAHRVNHYRREKSEISLGSWLIIALFVLVLIVRFPVWFPALNIYGLKESTTSGIVLENTLFSVVKTALFIYFLNRTVNTSKYKKVLYFTLTMISILFNVLTFFGTNRSLTIEILISSLIMVTYYLPTYRKVIFAVTVPVGAIVIFMMFITKQFGVETLADFKSTSTTLQYWSNQLEEYTNGPWCIAQTYQASRGLSFFESFQAVTKEVLNALFVVFEIPGLKGINSFAGSWSSSTDIFVGSFQIVNRYQTPSFSSSFFYLYDLLGWIIAPIGCYVCIRLLIKYSLLADNCTSMLRKYSYIWSSILFGLIFCYSPRVLLYCMAKYAWFIWIILLGNRFRVKFVQRCRTEK